MALTVALAAVQTLNSEPSTEIALPAIACICVHELACSTGLHSMTLHLDTPFFNPCTAVQGMATTLLCQLQPASTSAL